MVARATSVSKNGSSSIGDTEASEMKRELMKVEAKIGRTQVKSEKLGSGWYTKLCKKVDYRTLEKAGKLQTLPAFWSPNNKNEYAIEVSL